MSSVSTSPNPRRSPSSPAAPLSPGAPVSLGALHPPAGRRPRERSPSPMRGHLIPSPLPTRRTRTFSAIEGEYVPMEGDEVTYKVCSIPPKNEKLQAVEVVITHLAAGTKHETWSGHIISS